MTILHKHHIPRTSFNSETDVDNLLDKLRFKDTVELYQYIASLTTVHRHLIEIQGFKDFPSIFSYHTNPNHLTALSLLRQSNEGGA